LNLKMILYIADSAAKLHVAATAAKATAFLSHRSTI